MIRRDTQAWILQTWIMFGIASFAAVFGLFQLELEFSTHGFAAITRKSL